MYKLAGNEIAEKEETIMEKVHNRNINSELLKVQRAETNFKELVKEVFEESLGRIWYKDG